MNTDEKVLYATTRRYQAIFDVLVASGSLDIRRGSVTLHFDHENNLQEIETHVKNWKRVSFDKMRKTANIA